MGVMSRRVLPACGNLCFFCPSLRARSRHPVKRYKKMLAEIFPRNQDAEPNDRKIGKLCEYASRNPLRIPKITEYLEQKCYKELRNGNIGSVKVVLCIYKRLLSSCKEQMPLFSCSLLSIVRTLLEQSKEEEVQILGCNTLVDFISLQTENSHMFNLEGLIPKLCQLAQEMGDDERSLRLRSAGMQALAFMVSFIGEHSQLSMDMDMIITVVLENYMDLEKGQEDTKEVGQNSETKIPNMSKKVSFKPNPVTDYKLENMDISKSPSYWSMVCLCNIAKLAKETTTVRRVLEPLLTAFDIGNYWSPEKGVASSVLLFLQSRLEESGENCHVLVSSLIKHLDHKNVVKQQGLQVNMVNVATCLVLHAKQQASGAMTAVIADLIKHLRKCLQNAAESDVSVDETRQNSELQHALENCISELSNKVGDAGPILDMLAVVLETISTNVVVARTTASAVLCVAHIVSKVPNVSYHKKVFPDALFHQLLLAMSHTDWETRVEAHKIFSVLLLRTLCLPWSDQYKETSEAVSRILSVDGTCTGKSQSISLQEEERDQVEESLNSELHKDVNYISHPSESRHTSLSCQSLDSLKDVDDGIKSLCSLRLSSHQVNMLLSSLWIQANSTENTPANFEAMASTYNITILFSLAKRSNHMALVRCFQLAFSLRNLSLNQDGMQLPQRRSIFTFASYVLIFSAKVSNIPEIIPIVKESLTAQTVDPYLVLEGDIRLRALCSGFPQEEVLAYGSEKDNSAGLSSSVIVADDRRLKEIVITHFTSKFQTLSEEEKSNLRKEIQSEFSRDDAHPLGASLFVDTPGPSSPLNQIELPAFEEVELSAIDAFEGISPGASGSQSGHRTSLSTNTNPVDVLSVNELLESVSETARQVASLPVSSTPVPYDQMMNQCEALVTGKQQKMSVLRSFKPQAAKAITFSEDDEKEELFLLKETEEAGEDDDDEKALTVAEVQPQGQLGFCSHEVEQNSFRLPPSSPYDKFLKAAGC
uniref:Protein EFR3-like protein n=1 Tax=Noccaea caerulescens TaxID=107243 RepID=A0A1J3CQ97_NOCCA